MTHEESLPLLEAFVDDELDVAGATAVDAHIQGCEHCAAWVTSRRQLRAQLRAQPLRYEIPDSVLSRLRTSVSHAASPLRWLDSWPRAAAAGILLAAGGLLIGYSFPRPAALSDEIVGAHVRSVLSPHAVDVVSSDHHTVKPWLSGQLPFSPPVPQLSARGDVLVGGRVDYVNHTRVAALVYQHGQHRVDVFVWPTSLNRHAVPSAATVDGFHVIGVTVGAFSVALVSDMGADELRTFAVDWKVGAQSPN